MNEILEILKRIEEKQHHLELMLISQKNVLTFEEAATYMGISKSHLYKHTMNGSVPFYKPNGKMVYFDRVELENWLMQNKVEIEPV